MIKSGQYVIIPMQYSCMVFDTSGEKPILLAGNPDKTPDENFNTVRKSVFNIWQRELKLTASSERSWKRFQATKEFMSPTELKTSEKLWEKFNYAEYMKESEEISSSLETAFSEVTELMLEYNIALEAMDVSPPQDVSFEGLENLLTSMTGSV